MAARGVSDGAYIAVYKGDNGEEYTIADVATAIIEQVGDESTRERTLCVLSQLSPENFTKISRAFQIGVSDTDSVDYPLYDEDEYVYESDEDFGPETPGASIAFPQMADIFKSFINERSIKPETLAKALETIGIIVEHHLEDIEAREFCAGLTPEQVRTLSLSSFNRAVCASADDGTTIPAATLYSLLSLPHEQLGSLAPYLPLMSRELSAHSISTVSEILQSNAPLHEEKVENILTLLKPHQDALLESADLKDRLSAKLTELEKCLPRLTVQIREARDSLRAKGATVGLVNKALLSLLLESTQENFDVVLAKLPTVSSIHLTYVLEKSPKAILPIIQYLTSSEFVGFFSNDNKQILYTLLDIVPHTMHASMDPLLGAHFEEIVASEDHAAVTQNILQSLIIQDQAAVTRAIHSHTRDLLSTESKESMDNNRVALTLMKYQDTLLLEQDPELLLLAQETASKATTHRPEDGGDLGLSFQLYQHGVAMRAMDNPFARGIHVPEALSPLGRYRLDVEQLRKQKIVHTKESIPEAEGYTVEALLGPGGTLQTIRDSLPAASRYREDINKFIFAGDGYNSSVVGFLTLPEEADAEVKEETALFIKAIDYFMTLDNEERFQKDEPGTRLTAREWAFVGLCNVVQGCAAGRRIGVQTLYQNLPEEAKYPFQSDVVGDAKPLIELIYNELDTQKERIISSRDFINSLKKAGDPDEIGDWAHPLQYMRNLIGLPLKMQTRLTFDINIGLTPKGIRDRSYDEVMDKFLKEISLESIAGALQEVSREHVDLIHSILKEANLETIEGDGFDEEFNPTPVTSILKSGSENLLAITSTGDVIDEVELTKAGALELLQRLGFCERRSL